MLTCNCEGPDGRSFCTLDDGHPGPHGFRNEDEIRVRPTRPPHYADYASFLAAVIMRAGWLLRTGFCEGAFAKDPMGRTVAPVDRRAKYFCLVGALTRALSDLLPDPYPPDWPRDGGDIFRCNNVARHLLGLPPFASLVGFNELFHVKGRRPYSHGWLPSFIRQSKS